MPFSSEDFAQAWGRWEQHRRETGKKLTPTSVKLQFKKLAAIGEARAVRAIDHSIANGYQGIFEPTGRNGKPEPVDSGTDPELARRYAGDRGDEGL